MTDAVPLSANDTATHQDKHCSSNSSYEAGVSVRSCSESSPEDVTRCTSDDLTGSEHGSSSVTMGRPHQTLVSSTVADRPPPGGREDRSRRQDSPAGGREEVSTHPDSPAGGIEEVSTHQDSPAGGREDSCTHGDSPACSDGERLTTRCDVTVSLQHNTVKTSSSLMSRIPQPRHGHCSTNHRTKTPLGHKR